MISLTEASNLSDNDYVFSATTEPSLEVTEEEDIGFLVYYLGILFVIMCVNIPGNCLVISTVLRHDTLRQPCNYYIVSLAVTDLLIGIVYPIYNISHLSSMAPISDALGEWSACRFLVTCVLTLESSSSYHLVAITVTRYTAIVHPLSYHILLTNKRTAISIATIWALSIGESLFLYTIYEPGDIGYCQYEKIFSLTHIFVLLVLQLCIPFLIMVVLYIRIVRIARLQARVISLQIQAVRGTHGRFTNNEMRSTIMVSVLLGCFTIAWTPVIAYVFYALTCSEDCDVSPYIRASVRILLFLNSAINIFIYAGRLTDFRRHILSDCCSCFGALLDE